MIFDNDFDISAPATQLWAKNIISRIVNTPELQVDSPQQHPLEAFEDWIAGQIIANEEAGDACAAYRNATINTGLHCTEDGTAFSSACVEVLSSLATPTMRPPDTHHPYIYKTLRSRQMEAEVYDDEWWGMTPALTVDDFGSAMDLSVAWPGYENRNKLRIEGMLRATAAGGNNAFQINDRFLMRWRGEVAVTADQAGLYEFSITSDDGSMLYVDRERLLNNDGLHGSRTVQGTMQLRAGMHAVAVTFFEWDGGEFLQCMWRKADANATEEFRALNGAGFAFDLYTLGNRPTPSSSILPISRAAFTACVSDPGFLTSSYNKFLWSSDPGDSPTDRIVAHWYVATQVVGSWNYYVMADYVSHWQTLFATEDRAFATQYWFGVMDLQANLATSALVAMGISLVLACSVLLAATRSIIATLLATISIFGVLSCTLATLVWQGWELGILESMCLAILVGISCDFVVHLAHAYMTSLPVGKSTREVRRERTRWALSTMGISVLSAGGTTLVAAFALSNGQVEFFHAFGTFLMLTISFALVFALIGFSAAAMVLGPTTERLHCIGSNTMTKSELGLARAKFTSVGSNP